MKTMLKTVILLALIPCAAQAAQVAPAKRVRKSGPNLLAVRQNQIILEAQKQAAMPEIDLRRLAHLQRSKKNMGARVVTLEPVQLKKNGNFLNLPQAAQEPAPVVESDKKMEKEWEELTAKLNDDLEMNKTAFEKWNCRHHARTYIDSLYESEEGQRLLKHLQTSSKNTNLTLPMLKKEVLTIALAGTHNISSYVNYHPYLKFLIKLTGCTLQEGRSAFSLGLKLCQNCAQATPCASPTQVATVPAHNDPVPAQTPTQDEQVVVTFKINVETPTT